MIKMARKAPRVTVGLFAAIALTGIACVNSGRKSAKADTTTASNPAETVDQAALIAANAKLEAEISAIKAGRDSFAGITVQNATSVTLAALLAIVVLSQTWINTFDRWCEYRESKKA